MSEAIYRDRDRCVPAGTAQRPRSDYENPANAIQPQVPALNMVRDRIGELSNQLFREADELDTVVSRILGPRLKDVSEIATPKAVTECSMGGIDQALVSLQRALNQVVEARRELQKL